MFFDYRLGMVGIIKPMKRFGSLLELIEILPDETLRDSAFQQRAAWGNRRVSADDSGLRRKDCRLTGGFGCGVWPYFQNKV
jgi:hypothetical protein